jgi:hypothetical protein
MERRTMMNKVEPQTLELMVQQTSYHERDNALNELRGAIAKILQPRGGYYFYAGSPNKHFLPIPPGLKVKTNKAGWPSGEVDPKEAAELQGQLTEITQEEKRLDSAAQKAKNQIEPLLKWGGHLGEVEDMLLLAGSVLDEEDTPAVMAYLAEHRRFIRTLNRLTDGLRF